MSKQLASFDDIPAHIAELNERMERMERLLEQLANSPNSGMDEVMEVEEVAQFLNLSSATIYSKVSRGELPFSKRGRRLVFSKRKLTEWSLSSERQTFSEKSKQVIEKMQQAHKSKK